MTGFTERDAICHFLRATYLAFRVQVPVGGPFCLNAAPAPAPSKRYILETDWAGKWSVWRVCSVTLLEDALSFTASHSLREPEVLEEQWTWFLEASAWSIRRLHHTVMVTVQATSQSTAPLTTIVVTPFPVVLLLTTSVPQSNFSLKKCQMEISESKKSTDFTYLSMQASLFI